jgi:hypothetical protein
MQTVVFEGTQHVFPDDFSQADISAALKAAPSLLSSMGEGLKSGVTGGFSDELTGALAAGRTTLPSFISTGLENAPGMAGAVGKAVVPAIGAGKSLYEYLAGQNGPATKAYQTARDQARAEQKAAEAAHPYGYGTGAIGGAIATLPATAEINVVRGAGLVPRMINSAVQGAGYGAAYGAGEGEGLADTLKQAGIGAATGGAVGAVAPPFMEALGGVGRALAAPFRGSINPTSEAQRRVISAYEAAYPGMANPTERVAQGLDRARQEGVPLIAGDFGGQMTRELARSAGNTSPQGLEALQNAVMPRVESAKDRAVDVIRSIAGGPGTPEGSAARLAIEAQAARENFPRYERAMNDGANGVWNPELQRIAGAPDIRKAANAAVPSLGNRSIAEGFRAPRQNPLTWDRDTGLATPRTLSNGNQTIPDLRFWDQVKRGLDTEITKAQNFNDAAKVGELTGLKDQLVAQLDLAVPAYRDARAGAARFFGADNALSAGEGFVTSKLGNSEAQRALRQMPPAERSLFREGFASELIKQVREVPDRTSVVNRSFINSQAARERIELALGPRGAREMEAFLRLERIMETTSKSIMGNSSSVRQFMSLTAAGGSSGLGYALGTGDTNPLNITAATVVGALLKHRRQGINVNVAQRVGEILASGDPQVLRDAVTHASRNSRMLDAVRQADNVLARAAATQQPRQGQQ